MFVEKHVILPMPFDRALPAVQQGLRGPRLQHRSAHAVGIGLQLMTVRPSLLPHRLAKLVRATIKEPHAVGRTTVIPMRWSAVGSSARFYPSLDARIGVTASDDVTTVLSLVGTYTPPLGRLGRGLDGTLLHRVAEATIDTFLAELADGVGQSSRTSPSTTSTWIGDSGAGGGPARTAPV